MARSRSSFDLGGAIATATHLTPSQPSTQPAQPFEGVALVSFEAAAASTQAVPKATHAGAPPAAEAAPISAPRGPSSTAPPAASTSGPPKLPDLSAVVSPILRCEKIVEWIGEATGATDIFLADGAGLPLAGAIADAEERIATAGLVASSIASFAAALPRTAPPIFETHVGDGPFFQLVGFQAGAAMYVVGLTRATPLTPRQAHAIRLACRHALGDTLSAAEGRGAG